MSGVRLARVAHRGREVDTIIYKGERSASSYVFPLGACCSACTLGIISNYTFVKIYGRKE